MVKLIEVESVPSVIATWNELPVREPYIETTILDAPLEYEFRYTQEGPLSIELVLRGSKADIRKSLQQLIDAGLFVLYGGMTLDEMLRGS